MRTRSLLLTLPAAALLGGCYNYRVETGIPRSGATIEAVLSDAGTVALTARVGPNAATILGTLAGTRGDSLDIAVDEVRTRDGLTYYMKGTTIALVRDDLAQLRVRELDRRRTAIAGVVGVLGAGAIIAGVRFGGGGSDNTGGGGGLPAARPRP